MSAVSAQEHFDGTLRETHETTAIRLFEVYEAFNIFHDTFINLWDFSKSFLGKSINKESPAGSYLYAPLRVLVRF